MLVGGILVVLSTKKGLFTYWRISCQKPIRSYFITPWSSSLCFHFWHWLYQIVKKNIEKGNCAFRVHNMMYTVMSGTGNAASYKYVHIAIPIHTYWKFKSDYTGKSDVNSHTGRRIVPGQNNFFYLCTLPAPLNLLKYLLI